MVPAVGLEDIFPQLWVQCDTAITPHAGGTAAQEDGDVAPGEAAALRSALRRRRSSRNDSSISLYLRRFILEANVQARDLFFELQVIRRL